MAGRTSERGKRLILVAGITGCGKTSFLKRPNRYLQKAQLPEELPDMFPLARKHMNLIDVLDDEQHEPELSRQNICLHFDLMTPIIMINKTCNNREDLLEAMNIELFSSWSTLVAMLEEVSEIHIVTLFVRREEHFRRWINRALPWPYHKLRTKPTLMIGDSTNNSEIHRKMYQCWQEFVEKIDPTSRHILNANGSKYSFMPETHYLEEIHNGYH